MATQLATDLENIEDTDAPGTQVDFVHVTNITALTGITYPAIISPQDKSKAMADSGFMPRSDYEIIVRKGAITSEVYDVTEPVENDFVKVDDVTHRIERITDDGVALHLFVVRVN